MNTIDSLERENKKEDKRKERAIYSSDELLEEEFPEADFLVDTILPQGGITCIAGDPNSFKSWVMLYLARQVSIGNKLWPDETGDGFRVKKANVFWVDEEVNAREIQRRWRKLEPKEEMPIHFMAQEGFQLDSTEERKWLLDKLKERDTDLLVFDSLRAVHSRDENDSQSAQMVLDWLHEFTREDITILCSHHKRKKDRYISQSSGQLLRGSTAFWAGFNSILAITADRVSQLVNDITCIHVKLKEGPKASSFKIRFKEKDGIISLDWLEAITNENVEERGVRKDIETFLTETKRITWLSELKDILGKAGHSERTTERVVSSLKEEYQLIPIPDEQAEEIKEQEGLHNAVKLFKWNIS